MAGRLLVQVPEPNRSHNDKLSASSRSSSFSPGKSPLNSTKSRRGGFGDTGLLNAGGDLPTATVVPVTSERQLLDEINSIVTNLHPELDWEKRVLSLLRLEGLVKGGAASRFPSQFSEHLQSLHGPLAAQLQDRRSAVSRQVCHVIVVLVEELGMKMEYLAIGLQVTLLKAPGMSIQIVTEASQACFRSILRHCPSSRLLPPLCATVRLDKNVKLRQYAAEHILQVIQEWDPMVYERNAEALEEAILAAAQDAATETREAGRAAFVAYYSKRHAAAQMMLQRLSEREYALKEKLVKAVQKVHGQDSFKAHATATVTLTTRQIPTKSPPPTHSHNRRPHPEQRDRALSPTAPPPTLGKALRVPHNSMRTSMPSPSQPSYARGTSSSAHSSEQQVPATLLSKPRSRKSLGGALRVPAPTPATKLKEEAAPLKQEYGNPPQQSSSRQLVTPSVASRRMTRASSSSPGQGGGGGGGGGAPMTKKNGGAGTVSATAPRGFCMPAQRERVTLAPSSSTTSTGTGGNGRSTVSPSSTTRMPFLEALSTLHTTKPIWSKKVAIFEAIQAHLEQGTIKEIPDNTTLMNQFIGVLLDGTSDAHFKIAGAALSALIAALRCPPVSPSMSSYLETIIPALFAKIGDGKEQIRQLIGAALALLPHNFEIEYIIHGLVSTAQNAKSPKILCAVMDYFAEMAGNTLPGRKHPAETSIGRNLLFVSVTLASHKNPDVRSSALGTLAAVYSTGHAAAVENAIASMPTSPQASVTRSLAQILEPGSTEASPPSPGPSPLLMERSVGVSGSYRSPSPFNMTSRTLPSPSLSPSSSPEKREGRFYGGGSGGVDFEDKNFASSRSTMMYEEPIPATINNKNDNSNDNSNDDNMAPPCAPMGGVVNNCAKKTRSPTRTPTPDILLSTPRPSSSMTRRLNNNKPVTMMRASPTPGAATHTNDNSDNNNSIIINNGDGQYDPQSSVASWQSRPFSSKYNKSPPPMLQMSTDDGSYPENCVIHSPGAAFLLSSKNLPQLLVELRKTPTVAAMQTAPGLAHGLGEKEVKALCLAVCDGVLMSLRSNLDEELQEASLEAFLTLCPVMSVRKLSELGPSLVEQLLKASTRGIDVALVAASASKALISRVDAVTALSLILSHLPEVDSRPPFDGDRAKIVLSVIKMLESAISNVKSEELMAVVESIMPSLAYCYSSANADIRKTSVGCIVKMHQIIGEDTIKPYLSVLSTAQQKLVEIYVQR